MSRRKKKRPLCPRTKRMDRGARLQSAKQWLSSEPPGDLVRAYCVRYAVDRLCALKELALLGHAASAQAFERAQKAIEARAAARRRRIAARAARAAAGQMNPDENAEFEFIAGYTAWGFPYGVPRVHPASTTLPAHPPRQPRLRGSLAIQAQQPTPSLSADQPRQGELFSSLRTTPEPNPGMQRTRYARR